MESCSGPYDWLGTLVERDRMSLCLKCVIWSEFTPRDDLILDRYFEMTALSLALPFVPFGSGVASTAMGAHHSFPGFDGCLHQRSTLHQLRNTALVRMTGSIHLSKGIEYS